FQHQTQQLDVVTKVNYGKTYENRTISLLWHPIGCKSASAKKAIWMDCRGWISPAFCEYFINQLLQTYKTDPEMEQMMKNMDFSVTPVLNLNLLTFRKPSKISTVINIGLSLLYYCAVAAVGVSFDWCSESYPGKSTMSRDKLMKSCFLTIHSYGQKLLIPYGHSNAIIPNENELMEVVGTSPDVLFKYTANLNSGSSRDWARLQGIPFAFTFELRDDGTYSFELPEDQIQPACEEAYSGALHIIIHVQDKEFIKPTGTAATVTATLWTTMMAVFVTSTAIV
uniref:Carboxypeptidase O n=1 Tax=Sphaeramia orbicularis TaxID=375764 RepID=A0A673B8K6_9TELE